MNEELMNIDQNYSTIINNISFPPVISVRSEQKVIQKLQKTPQKRFFHMHNLQ